MNAIEIPGIPLNISWPLDKRYQSQYGGVNGVVNEVELEHLLGHLKNRGDEATDQEEDFDAESTTLDVVSESPTDREMERMRVSTSAEETSATTSGDEDSATEELKQATKFSYFATALAGGGILSFIIFHLENSSGKPHFTLLFNVVTFFVLATFASGLSIIVLTICAPSTAYQKLIMRGLVYATLGFLSLSGVSVSIVLMKAMSELVFVPAIVVVIVACIIVYWKKQRDGVNIGGVG